MDPHQLRPLGVGEVLDAAIKIYRDKFAFMIKAVAVVIVPVEALNVLVVLSVPTQRTTFGTATTTTTISRAGLAAFVLTTLIGFVAGTLAQAACLKTVSDTYLGAESDWRGSLRFGYSRLGSLLWLALIHTVGLGLAFTACLVPGIWLYAAWSVAVPALLIEGALGFKALGRSYRLVQGRWWPTAGSLLLGNLLAGIVTFGLAILLVPLVIVRGSDTVTAAAQGILTSAASVLTTPFVAAIVAVIYFDLRVRKEGFDLQLLAQRVGTPMPPEGFTSTMPWAQPVWGQPGWGQPGWGQPGWGAPGAPGAPGWGAPPVQPGQPGQPGQPPGWGWAPPPAPQQPPGWAAPPAPPAQIPAPPRESGESGESGEPPGPPEPPADE